MTKALTFAVTGHRPDKLGGYTRRSLNILLEVAFEAVNSFVEPDETIISGMALGWDTAMAIAAISLNRRLIAAIPFKGQHKTWPQVSQNAYNEILAEADEVVIVCPGEYSVSKMYKRNHWMIDRCDAVISMYDGSKGGTAECLNYAERKKKPIVEMYSYFAAWELL